MYQYGKKNIKHKNITKQEKDIYGSFLVLLFGIILLLFFRVCSILRNNTERGALAYIELLNFGMPVIENVEYDEGSYVENAVSMKYVLQEALGLSKINSINIIRNELSIFSLLDSEHLDNSTNRNQSIYESFVIDEKSISKVDLNNSKVATQIYNPSIKKEIDKSKPEVLIYHTHTHENYDLNITDSTNEETNVVGVGNVLAQELEERYGISVIHDKTDHCISYNDSYTRAGETVDKYINKYGDFKLIIDLHRDSVQNKDVTTTVICGESSARIVFVNAENSDKYAENKEITEKLFNKTSELFPTLPRKIVTYTRGKNAFNQSKSGNSTLFEIGSNSNTPEESKVCAQCMARVIAEVLAEK